MQELLIIAALLFGIASGSLYSLHFLRKKEHKEVVAYADDIDEDSNTNRVIIYCDDITVILSILAEKRLMKIMSERERSSSMVI